MYSKIRFIQCCIFNIFGVALLIILSQYSSTLNHNVSIYIKHTRTKNEETKLFNQISIKCFLV